MCGQVNFPLASVVDICTEVATDDVNISKGWKGKEGGGKRKLYL